MSFLGNLGRGFIRSAVNQVGRDYGRTISNDVFGDRHAIPHRAVGQPMYVQQQPTPPPLPNQLPPGGTFETQHHLPLWVVASIIIPIVGGCAAAIAGINVLAKRDVDYTYHVSEAAYTSDARYRSGRRYVGDIVVKKRIRLPRYNVDERIVKSQRTTGILLTGIGTVFAFAWLCLIAISTQK